MTRNLLIVAAVLPIAACTAETDREPEIKAPAVQVAGEPVSCILTSRIQNTIVHDDYTIDFDMLGDEVYRNTLPARCPQLGWERRFAHSSSTAQLCRVDTVTVLTIDGQRAASCGLGEFVPVRYLPDAD